MSRRLGYRSNVVAKWEAGRRMPTASEALLACARLGGDVPGAFRRFRPATAALIGDLGDDAVAAWLSAQRGGRRIGDIAAAAGCSRYQVSRMLSGATRPRLPELFALVDALTGRLPELVAGLVDIEAVGGLASAHARVVAARRAALEEPWSAAVLALVATGGYRGSRTAVANAMATTLGLEPEAVERCLALLQRAGAVSRRRGGYAAAETAVVDVRRRPGEAAALRAHWARASLARLEDARSRDLFSYNVVSVSREDYERLRALQLEHFQQVRALAAASEPSQVAGLFVTHLIQWDPS
ncbi:MAG: DUF4423 domain-containing protein [Myxococcales bacterium]|nr:DUF4423 domain-containing protein [Myxococcales bacterium]